MRGVIIALMFSVVPPSWAAIGTVERLIGEAYKSHDRMEWEEVKEGELLFAGYYIRTGEKSRLTIRLKGGSELTLGELSELLLDDVEILDEGVKGFVRLLGGKLRAFMKKVLSFEVRTKTAIAGVKGTEFIVWSPIDTLSIIICLYGTVEVISPELGQSVILTRKTMTQVIAGAPPLPPSPISDELKKLIDELISDTPSFSTEPANRIPTTPPTSRFVSIPEYRVKPERRLKDILKEYARERGEEAFKWRLEYRGSKTQEQPPSIPQKIRRCKR